MSANRLPTALQNLILPVIGSPMFIASGPELVLAQCKAGIVGAFPALNARPAGMLDTWLTDMRTELDAYKAEHPEAMVGPIAVNQIVHQSNDRLAHDVEVCVKHRVPIIISSLRAPPAEMLEAIHSYGGIVLHDVISIRHAKKALEAGDSAAGALAGLVSGSVSVETTLAAADALAGLVSRAAGASDCDNNCQPPNCSTTITAAASTATTMAARINLGELRRRLLDSKRLSENGVADKSTHIAIPRAFGPSKFELFSLSKPPAQIFASSASSSIPSPFPPGCASSSALDNGRQQW